MSLFKYLKNVCKPISKVEDDTKNKPNNKIKNPMVIHYSPIIVNGLNKYEIEYLKKLNGKKEEDILPDYWDVVLKNRANSKKNFLKNNLLEKANVKEMLKLSTVIQLKNILKENNIKVSGNKTELIDRILDNIDEKQIRLFFSEDLYVLSDKGLSIIKEYKELLNKYELNYISKMYKFIKNEDYELALNEAWEYSNCIDININAYCNNGLEKPKVFYNERFENIIREINILSLDDLDNTDEFKQLFKLAIKYSYISNNGYISNNDVVNFLNNFTEETLKCNSLEDFLQNHEIYLTKISPYKNTTHLYLYTVNSIIHNNIELTKIKTNTGNRSYAKGIEILCANNIDDHCDICKNHNKKVTWNQLYKLPKLPAHYGCRCSYLLWTEDTNELESNN